MNATVPEAVSPIPFVFNNQQQAAMDDIVRWYNKTRAMIKSVGYISPDVARTLVKELLYVLQGYAGTGKTTLVKMLLEMLGIPLNRIALVAPTNRAAKVLANKTGLFTRTLFSLIYSSQREELEFQRQRLRSWDEASSFPQLADLLISASKQDLEGEFENEWEEHYAEDSRYDDPEKTAEEKAAAFVRFREARGKQILSYEDIQLSEDAVERQNLFAILKKERMEMHRKTIKEIMAEDLPTRRKDPSEIAAKYDVIVCDEASMVNQNQGRDLLCCGVPVLLVGDPFQLPPVKAKAFWEDLTANSVLTKIERQKGLGAGIPLAGERLRTGKTVERNESVGVWNRNELPEEKFMEADQILVGTHRTRERLCNFIRRLRGYTTEYPVAGEKIVAVYNDKAAGIMNGELYEVVSSELIRGGSVVLMDIRDPFGLVIPKVQAWTKGFSGRDATGYLDEEFGKFWFGYAITCHQSQGSEWKNVVVCDDWPKGDVDTWKRWLYTALTRASQRVEWIKG